MLSENITLVLVFCAGCAGLCAGFVRGMRVCKSMKVKGFLRLVQGVQAIARDVRVCVCAYTRIYAWMIFQKPCTPCTNVFNLLKKRGKIILKLCTNPAHNPAQYAQP